MSRSVLVALVAVAASASKFPELPPIDDDGGGDAGGDGSMTIDAAPTPVNVPAGDLTTDTTWTADHVYVLQGVVFVRNATLTIQAGTQIRGEAASALVITTSGRIDAQGTSQAPVVFTSASPGARAPGDWGGVVLMGLAPVHGAPLQVPGFPPGTDPTKITFGGNAPGHDCGRLEYVRIEFAGYDLRGDYELDGLTVAACGSGTRLDHLQVHRVADDGIEFFGGTADLRHALVTRPDDDGLDWQNGWIGRVQWLVIQRDTAMQAANAIEGDNNSTQTDAVPRSAPEIWNYTLVGLPTISARGMTLRAGTGGKLNNGVVQDLRSAHFDVIGDPAEAQWAAGVLDVRSTYFHNTDGSSPWPAAFETVDDGFDEEAQIRAHGNVVGSDPMLLDPTSLTAPVFRPAAASPVLNTCVAPPVPFDNTAAYCGGVGVADWTVGWTSFP